MTEPKLSGRVAIVTGSGQNIGRAIALRFADEGAAVVINGAGNRENVDRVVAEIAAKGQRAIGVMADVGDPEQVGAMVAKAREAFGTVDIVVNNVGRRRKQALRDITIADWREVIETNLSGCFYMVHFVLPMMQAGGWGRIINISGYDGFAGHMTERAHNIAAKAGMHGLTKALARELGREGITANTVVPGAISTTRDMSQYSQTQMDEARRRTALGHAGSVEDIAQACLYLAGESGCFVTGQAIHVNGGEFMF